VLVDQPVQTPGEGQFHHQVKLVVKLAKLVNVNDVRMVELSHRTCLGIERLQPLLVLNQFGLHQLDGDIPLEHGVGGPVNCAHPARGDPRVQLKMLKHHRHHQLAAALGAGCDLQRAQVAGNECIGPARDAVHQLQRLAWSLLDF